MAMRQNDPKPPLLAFLTALIFSGTLAGVGLSIFADNLLPLLCGVPVAFGLTWIWVNNGQDVAGRAALFLSISITMAIESISWKIFPGNWMVSFLLASGVAFVSYLLLGSFLGSVVEFFWALSLRVRPHVPELETLRRFLYIHEPRVGGLIWRMMITKLQQDGSEQSMKLLATAVTDHPDRQVRLQALRALNQLTSKAAIDALCAVWADTRHIDLAELLFRKKWRASAPPENFILSALLLGDVDFLRKSNAEQVQVLAWACLDADPLISGRAIEVLQGLENVEAQEALCRLFSEQENPAAQSAAVSAGYLPRDDRERALFLFMTGQWERYASHDFDRRLMHLTYDSAADRLRQRIREKLRSAGRIDFLPIIAGENSEEHTTDLNTVENELLVRTLIANRSWAVLWLRVFELPFQLSVYAMAALSQSGWKPADRAEQVLFAKLAGLLADGLLMDLSKMPELIPPVTPQATVHVSGMLSAVAFSPVHPIFAIGTENGKVVLWNHQTGARERVLPKFENSIGAVAFSSDGTLFCAERNNTTPRPIYAFPDVLNNDTSFCLGTHEGSVTALVAMNGSRLLSAESGYFVRLWDRSTRKEIRSRSVLHRGLRVSPDGTQVLLFHRSLDLLSLPDMEDIAAAREDATFRCAAFAPDHGAIFAGMSSGKLFVYKRSENHQGRLVAEELPLTEYSPSETVEAVEVLKQRSLLVSAGMRGEIRFFSLNEYRHLHSFTFPGGMITSLNVSPDESFLAVGSAEETLKLWDLRTLNVHLLLERPFAQADLTMLSSLQVLLGRTDLSEGTQRVLQFAQAILRHRFRYAIEVGEAPSIALGEFDIEID